VILQGDCQALPLRDKSVGGIITSPPYNVGKSYPNDSFLEHPDYLTFLQRCYAECVRVSQGPVIWILPLLCRGHFLYAEVGDWQFASPILACSEKVIFVGDQFGRGWTRAYVSVELMVSTMKPPAGCWIIGGEFNEMAGQVVFAPAPFVGATERNRPRHPAPFVREVPGSVMRMFPDVSFWCDPFGGTGTTAIAAQTRNLRYVTMDLAWEYVMLQREELRQPALSTLCPPKRAGKAEPGTTLLLDL